MGGVTNLNGGVNVTGASNFNGVATFTNTAVAGQGSTTVNGGVVVLTNGTSTTQSITLDANADPVLTVTNGTAAGTTTINNGDVTAGGNVKAGGNLQVGGTATVSGQAFLNGGATVSNNLTVSPGASVDFGGNRLQNVATPVAPTDAVNKAYVDQGNLALNHRIDKANEGVSIALALSSPIFQPGQSFVIQGGWGGFQSSDAFGISAAGLVARDTFGAGSTVTVSAGLGAGMNTGTVAGRAAVAIGW